MSLDDLRDTKVNVNKDTDSSYKKFRLIIDEVEGNNCKTSFYGLSTTKDKLCNLIKKWNTLIEMHIDVKTKDGYFLRIFINTFTMRRKN